MSCSAGCFNVPTEAVLPPGVSNWTGHFKKVSWWASIEIRMLCVLGHRWWWGSSKAVFLEEMVTIEWVEEVWNCSMSDTISLKDNITDWLRLWNVWNGGGWLNDPGPPPSQAAIGYTEYAHHHKSPTSWWTEDGRSETGLLLCSPNWKNVDR